MICPVAHSEQKDAKQGCSYELKSLKAKDILKHVKMIPDMPEYLQTLHMNFRNHFSKLAGGISDEKQKWIVAYKYYFGSQKQSQRARKKHGIGNEGLYINENRFYAGKGGKELTAQEVKEIYGMDFPNISVPRDRMQTAKKKTEELQVKYGHNTVER